MNIDKYMAGNENYLKCGIIVKDIATPPSFCPTPPFKGVGFGVVVVTAGQGSRRQQGGRRGWQGYPWHNLNLFPILIDHVDL